MHQKCKKVIAWSGDCGMDQYVSLNLPSSKLTLDIIWGKYEEYCKPQSNEVWARFDLLTSFCQGNHSIDEWYNAVQAQVNLARYPLETAKILHRDIFWFFLWDEDFVSRTISDGSMSISTNSLQAEYVNWPKSWRAQKPQRDILNKYLGNLKQHKSICYDIRGPSYPNHRYKKKKSHTKPRQGNSKLPCRNDPQQGQKIKGNHFLPPSNRLPPSGNHNRCSKCGDTAHQEGFTCPAKIISVQGMSRIWALY